MSPERRRMRHQSRALRTWRAFERDLADELGWERNRADEAAFAVTGLLQQRLSRDEAADFMAQLPVVMKEHLAHWGEGDGGKLHRSEFEERVAHALQCSREEAVRASEAVFRTLRRHISEGESADVASQLPGDLAEWWRGMPVREGPGPAANGAVHQLM